MTMDENIKKGVISTWLIRSYKLQFKEYLEIMKQRDTYACDVDMEYDPSNLVFAKWLASKFYNHLDLDWYTKNALWIYWAGGDDEVELSDEESSDPDDENIIDEDEQKSLGSILMYFTSRHLRAELSRNLTIFYKSIHMSLLKILIDLKLTNNIRMTGYMSGMKIYHGIRRFKIIKYSFGQDEEYVAIKECEYDDLKKTNEDACRAYQEIFRSMDEGWVVTRAE
uniref:C2 calcium/lipid-binding domain, CaLB n=1 Tax=Tanacetum cinerariifolium TaxID=118510 RepID=A0A6L2M5A9_TANCI|nr:C2 calcium/lipid-binding domain, CaLB [Tanacetum cinerariifolium]GEX73805.1 C2 calcium/lipid-binding domain, CaLB [Tanacetum cinerariifolium]